MMELITILNVECFFKKKRPSQLTVFLLVVMDGIEPPTQGFSVLCSTN